MPNIEIRIMSIGSPALLSLSQHKQLLDTLKQLIDIRYDPEQNHQKTCKAYQKCLFFSPAVLKDLAEYRNQDAHRSYFKNNVYLQDLLLSARTIAVKRLSLLICRLRQKSQKTRTARKSPRRIPRL